jgi:hypothetical protein
MCPPKVTYWKLNPQCHSAEGWQVLRVSPSWVDCCCHCMGALYGKSEFVIKVNQEIFSSFITLGCPLPCYSIARRSSPDAAPGSWTSQPWEPWAKNTFLHDKLPSLHCSVIAAQNRLRQWQTHVTDQLVLGNLRPLDLRPVRLKLLWPLHMGQSGCNMACQLCHSLSGAPSAHCRGATSAMWERENLFRRQKEGVSFIQSVLHSTACLLLGVSGP